MNNISKLLMIALMVVSAVVIAQLINHPSGENAAVGRENILGKNSLEAFVSEYSSYEDRFIFTYSPKNPDSRFDCDITYKFIENGNALESVDKEFYGNVSTENPIVLEFPRNSDSTYELETTVEDKSGINLYKNKIEISPSTVENKKSS